MAMNGDDTAENRFNLVDEPWIPIAGMDLVSLSQVFYDKTLCTLGGNPIQKIALTKLLIAICQAAWTPQDNEDWKDVGMDGMAEKASSYLQKHKDCFWLYGGKPFLQIPAVKKAAKKSFGELFPDISTGNTTVLTQSQKENKLGDAEKAILVVQIMGFALGGKKTDNSIVLSAGYQGKFNEKGNASTGKPGTSSGFQGYLHNFLVGQTLHETIWLNILTKENINDIAIYPIGLGTAPWELMPKGENDDIAHNLQDSLMGRLVPMSRFVLLADDGINYTEGIAHKSHLEGVFDPSVAIKTEKKKKGKETIRALWTDTSKRPWRNLTSLLAFLGDEGNDYNCPYIQYGVDKTKVNNVIKKIGLWSGGLRLSSNAGEQYVSGTDDYVESKIIFTSTFFDQTAYLYLKNVMEFLDNISRILYGTVNNYYKELKVDGTEFAKKSSETFWQICEQKLPDLIKVCEDENEKESKKLKLEFKQIVKYVYEEFCPRETARQLDSWAKHYPYIGGEDGKSNKTKK